MGRRRVTREIVERALELRRQGYSLREIASILGVPKSTLHYHLSKLEPSPFKKPAGGLEDVLRSVIGVEDVVKELRELRCAVEALADEVRAALYSVPDTVLMYLFREGLCVQPVLGEVLELTSDRLALAVLKKLCADERVLENRFAAALTRLVLCRSGTYEQLARVLEKHSSVLREVAETLCIGARGEKAEKTLNIIRKLVEEGKQQS